MGNESIINKSRAELAAEQRRAMIETLVAFEANSILPHVANSSPTLSPVEVVDRAFAIARAMDERLRAVGVERSMGAPDGIVGPNGSHRF